MKHFIGKFHCHARALLLVAVAALTPLSAFASDNVDTPETIISKGNETIYGIGSISKVFPAVAVMQLVEAGSLELDAPLTRYIPEFTMTDNRYHAITPRMLLDHSSGLMGTSDHNAMLLGEPDTTMHDTLLEQLKTQRLKAAPGAFSVYSNDGFTLAEILVERVSGMSFTDYIKKNISTPLKMEYTVTPNTDFNLSQMAKIYSDGNLELPPESLNAIGAGGILSTAEDLCRFAQIFMRSGTPLLSKESVQEMATPQTNNPICPQESSGAFEYGLGWDSVNTYPFSTYGIQALSKGGDTPMFHGNLTVLPQQNMAAAILSSGGESTLNQMMANEILLAALEEGGIIETTTAPDDTPAASTWETSDQILLDPAACEGYYISDGALKVRFGDDNMLYLTTLDERRQVTQEYQSTGDGHFLSTNGGYISMSGGLTSMEGGTKGKSVIHFRKGTNDRTYLMVSTNETKPGLGSSAASVPFAEKIEEQKLSGEIITAWKQRDGKKYYLVSEKATSSANINPVTTIRLPREDLGYFRNARIIDENFATSFVELPIMKGRDLLDFYFYSENGGNFFEMIGGGVTPENVKRRYQSEDSMEALPQESFTSAIQKDGYNKWYIIPQTLAGREITVTCPQLGAYFIFDQNDKLTASSLAVNMSPRVKLPENGKILLAGGYGESFTVEFSA